MKLIPTLLMINISIFCSLLSCDGSKNNQHSATIKTKSKKDDDEKKGELKKILAHQKKRFDTLDIILKKDPKYRIKFPGLNAENHALGTGIAKGSWPSAEHAEMVKYISDRIKKLETDFPGRISFGFIGDYNFIGPDCDSATKNPQGVPGPQADGTFIIHVWGANAGNFNQASGTKGPWGAGQATCFKDQRPGVFGISTMPGGDKTTLMADDKLLSLY